MAADGTFTAASSGSGLATVTAKVGDRTASTTVAVGTEHQNAIVADDPSKWSFNHENGTAQADAFEASDDVPEGSGQKASVKLPYTMPGTPGVHQLVFWPNSGVSFDENAQGATPTSITLWAKIDDPTHSAFQACISLLQANGQTSNIYVPESDLTFGEWAPITVQVPAGATFPLSLNWLDLLSIRPTAESKGTLYIGSMTADYSPRKAAAYSYTPLPQNPDWLSFTTPDNFKVGGTTYLMGDDAHMLANDPGSASSVNMDNIAKRVKGESYTTSSGQTVKPLASNGTPTLVQMLGDMSDNGELDNLKFARDKIKTIGLPLRNLVGNHEDTQGTIPEDKNFAQVYGDTHYSYRSGQSTFIALDNSRGSTLTSDPYQQPTLANGQYSWLVEQLDATKTPVVVVGIHMPAYDPFPTKNSQFADRWEASQFLQIVQNYQNAHPDKHVMVVHGHARGFSEQILTPQGQTTTWSNGIPSFVFGDLGMPAYSTAEQGGFYHFGLVHVNDDGSVQFAVEPLLSSLSIDQGTAASQLVDASGKATANTARSVKYAARDVTKIDEIAVNTTKQYSAHGICQQGDNKNPEVNLPIANPVSHKWSTSDESVASIDPNTGLLTAHKEGDVEVRISAGGITAVSKLHVKAATTPVAKSIDTVKVTVEVGKTPQLPENVTARFSDGSTRQLPVTWNAHDWSAEKAGTVTLAGTVAGTDLKAKAVVIITAATHNGTDQSQGSGQGQDQPSGSKQKPNNGGAMAVTGIAIDMVVITAVITTLIAGTLMAVKRRRRL